MATGTLDGINIVDLGGSVACLAATLFMAEAGADVVMVEPPGGSPLRAMPGFRTWGRSKCSVEIDIETEVGRAELDSLLTGADVVVHSIGPTEARRLGVDDVALAARHPNLIVSSILAWPVNHEEADAPVDDHLTLARLGVLDEQLGQREGPVYVRFPLGTWPAAWLAVIGVMSRLISRGRTGVVGPAHTSLAQGALIPMMMHWSRSETPSDLLRIGMPKDNMRASLFECSDGKWIHIMPPPPDNTPLMQEVFAEMGPELVAAMNAEHEGEGFPGWENWGAIIEAFKRRPRDAWLQNMWNNDIPAQGAFDMGSILSDEQARVNRYVVDIDDPLVGAITIPGLPLTLDPPTEVRNPAPTSGENDDNQDWTRTAPIGDGAPTQFPLEGVKLLDFGNFLAGPLGPMLLADLGATVVKVEAATGDPMRWADWPFAGCQRGKRGVALDIKSPDSRPALEAMLGWADIVHHNLRIPAATRLGLDSKSVRDVNPDVIFCHVSSYGPAGPRADWPGYDQLFQASCGWEMMGAGVGNPPMWHRFGFMDHLCALSSVAGTLMALFQQDRTGRPTDVAASLLGAGAMTNSETFLTSDGVLEAVPMLDGDQMLIGPGRRIMQSADGWVATAADDDEQIRVLCGSIGVADPDDLPAAVSELTSADVLARLASAGVPSAEVRLDQKFPFFDDPNHQAAGMIAAYDHLAWGKLEQPGAMWFFGDQDVKLDRAPPLLGQHTTEVLREVGVDQATIDSLLSSGAAVDNACPS
jgi:crotonobetainyl-CoA:carnitine CoA-transferase CaiB-like acyl-CoA transferase